MTVITDSRSQHKQVIAHPDMIPDIALIDACLMIQLPPAFTAATGVDALTHAIEAYVAKNATPLTRALTYQALRMIGQSLSLATGCLVKTSRRARIWRWLPIWRVWRSRMPVWV